MTSLDLQAALGSRTPGAQQCVLRPALQGRLGVGSEELGVWAGETCVSPVLSLTCCTAQAGSATLDARFPIYFLKGGWGVGWGG